MTHKPPTEQTNSNDNEHLEQARQNLKEELLFEIQLKREAHFFSKWKKRISIIRYIPHHELTLTIKVKDKKAEEQVIDLITTKISKRCSIVQNHHSFGFQLQNGKRYLISRDSEARTIVMFQNLTRLKKYTKVVNSAPIKFYEPPSLPQFHPKLEFERSDVIEQEQSSADFNKIKQIQQVGEKKNTEIMFQEVQEQRNSNHRVIQEGQIYQEYETVMDDEDEPIEIQSPLHLKLPISSTQMSYLDSDQDFKLKQNFSQGRLLQKQNQYIKVNTLLKTHFSQKQLLESFFHIELWNDKVNKYQLVNRIDAGIYLVYLELHKTSLFGSKKCCYMMATSILIKGQPYLILKSLDRKNFQTVEGCEWIDLSLYMKVVTPQQQKLHHFASIVMKVEDEKNYSIGFSFMQQLKLYQSFLMTTNQLPHQLLQWRNSCI